MGDKFRFDFLSVHPEMSFDCLGVMGACDIRDAYFAFVTVQFEIMLKTLCEEKIGIAEYFLMIDVETPFSSQLVVVQLDDVIAAFGFDIPNRDDRGVLENVAHGYTFFLSSLYFCIILLYPEKRIRTDIIFFLYLVLTSIVR